MQKTAYEMLRSLVGSEMCIRDRCGTALVYDRSGHTKCTWPLSSGQQTTDASGTLTSCVLDLIRPYVFPARHRRLHTCRGAAGRAGRAHEKATFLAQHGESSDVLGRRDTMSPVNAHTVSIECASCHLHLMGWVVGRREDNRRNTCSAHTTPNLQTHPCLLYTSPSPRDS